MKLLYCLVICGCTLISWGQSIDEVVPIKIDNVRFRQMGDELLIWYDLSGSEKNTYNVTLAYSTDGGITYVRGVEGLEGEYTNVKPGIRRLLFWRPQQTIESDQFIVRLDLLTTAFDNPTKVTPVSPLASPIFPQIQNPRFYWCLDNGHGKEQDGKRSPYWIDEKGDEVRIEEWEYTRDIVRRVSLILDTIGVQYYNVVPEENVGSFLKERVARANTKEAPGGLPKMFISIHGNHASSGVWNNGVRGIETWTYPESRSGIALGTIFQTNLMQFLPDFMDRGLRSHQSGSQKIFYVLREVDMPAILCDIGFLTDEEEAKKLMQPKVRQRIAEALAASIVAAELNGIQKVKKYSPFLIIG